MRFCVSVLSVSLFSAVFGADEVVTKTWELTIPDADNGGCTNNAHVMLSDGNYQLRGWIRNVDKKTIGLGVRGETSESLGLAIFKDAEGKLIGSGDLDLRGALTVDGVVSDWTIDYLGQYSFCDLKVAPFDVCILPTTLAGMSTATFQNCGQSSGFRKFVLHAPNMTGALPNNTFLSGNAAREVSLKIPKVTNLGGYWNRTGYDRFLSETDVSDWDVSSAQFIAPHPTSTQKDSGWIFRWGSFRGTMHLPSLKWLNARSFINCRYMNAIEAGNNGTLEYVGCFAMTNCAVLGAVTLGGAAGGWTISTNAFYSANITNVTFLTTPPSYEEPNSIIFGTEATPARQIAFYIPPRDTAGWKVNWGRFVAAARAATDAERADFTARFGTVAAEGLIGIVPAQAFRTAQEQWLVCGVPSTVRFTVKAALMDPRFEGDAVTISPPPDADGRYAVGTEVTITAHPNTEKGAFVRWRGVGVREAEEGNASLTLKVDCNIDILAQMAHDWTFRPGEDGYVGWKLGTISNQVWKLNVRINDAGKNTLLYGTGSNGSAWTDLGEGMLDLNGRIFMETEAGVRQEMTVVGFSGDAFKGPSYDGVPLIPNARYPRALVMREDLAVNPNQHFRCGNGTYAVTNFIYECPELVLNMGTDGFCAFSMNSGRLRLPKVTKLFSNYTWTLTNVDVSDWRLDSVTNVVGETKGTYGVFRGPFALQTFRGTLHLPALDAVQTNDFNKCSKMAAIEIGSNTVVTKIGTLAFNGCSSLSRIQLRAGKDLTVGANAFTGTTKLKTLEFTYEMPTDPVAVDNMLVGSTEAVADAANPPVIYASRLMGWNGGKTARIRRATDAELAARPWWVKNDSSLIGVWVTADDVAKAWVVNVPCPEDPKGTFLFFR